MTNDLHIEVDHDKGRVAVSREVMHAPAGTISFGWTTVEVTDVVLKQVIAEAQLEPNPAACPHSAPCRT